LSSKNTDKLPFFYLKKQRQYLVAVALNFKTFDFKSSFKQNKRLKLPYFSLNKLPLQENLQNLKKKYLQILNTGTSAYNYNYAKIVFPKRGGYILETFSGLRGFVSRFKLSRLLKKEFFFYKIINSDLLNIHLKSKYNRGGWLPVTVPPRGAKKQEFPHLKVIKKRMYTKKRLRSSYTFIIK